MKKIVHGYFKLLHILDPKDYIIIEKNKQHISDKYVNLWGNEINEYRGENKLKKGDVVIRVFYYINFWGEYISIKFNKFKYYEVYRKSGELTPELKQSIRTKNSAFYYFDGIKKHIVDIFSGDIKIKIS